MAFALNSTFAPPDESSGGVWIEVSTLVGESILGSAAYGIMFTLYVLCFNALYPQVKSKHHKNWALFHLAYITILFVLVGVGTAGNAQLVRMYWIDNRNYPGGPLAFIEQETSFATLIWCWAGYIVASWFQDGYVIYRCTIFWAKNYFISIPLILCFLGSVSTSIALIVEISRPGSGLTSKLAINLAICWYIFSVSINILATVAIVGKILWQRKRIRISLGDAHSKVYTGVMAMLVESALIYSVFGVIFIGTYFKQDPFNNIVLPILGTLEGICPLLIIYRVSIGRGWTNETVQQVATGSRSTFTNIKFNHGQGSTGFSRRTGDSTVNGMSAIHTKNDSEIEMSPYSSPGKPHDIDITVTTEHSNMGHV